MESSTSWLMAIPAEIRIAIIHLLLDDKNHKIFEIRNEDPDGYRRRHAPSRTSYRVLGRDLMRQSRPTTYQLVTDTDMHVSIMAVNRQLYEETSKELYGGHTFSFGRDIESVVPFFSDLTPHTRPLIREISLLKQGSVYTRDFDRCEWTGLCNTLSSSMQIKKLNLVVEGGRPSLGWAGLPEYTVQDFRTLACVRHDALDWVWELLSIRGLEKVDVSSEIHHCPPSHSSAMEFFAAFSASIEKGFAEFLHSELVHF